MRKTKRVDHESSSGSKKRHVVSTGSLSGDEISMPEEHESWSEESLDANEELDADADADAEEKPVDWSLKLRPWQKNGYIAELESKCYPGVAYYVLSPPISVDSCKLEGLGKNHFNLLEKNSFFIEGSIDQQHAAEFREILNTCNLLLDKAFADPRVLCTWKKNHPGKDRTLLNPKMPCNEDGGRRITITRPVWTRRSPGSAPLPAGSVFDEMRGKKLYYNRIPWMDTKGAPLMIDDEPAERLPYDRVICGPRSVIRTRIRFSAFFLDQPEDNSACVGVKLQFLDDVQLCIQSIESDPSSVVQNPQFQYPRFKDGTSKFM